MNKEEMLTDSILHPDVIKLVSISLSFILIFFCTKEFKFLMPRLDYDFLRQKYPYLYLLMNAHMF